MDVLPEKKSDEGIQKWIDSISTNQEGLQESTNRDTNDSSPVQNKKSCTNDDLNLGDEATSSSKVASEGTCKNIFQQMMRKKFSDKVTGASFNSDATSDSFQLVLDSRRRSAELILRNLGFCDQTPCRQTDRNVPERFFKKPSAANGIAGTYPPGGASDHHLDDSRDQMTVAVNNLIRLISTERCSSNHHKKADNDHTNDDNDDGDYDDVDGPVIPEQDGDDEATIEGGTILEAIVELFKSKISMNGFGGNSTNASGTPPGLLRGGGGGGGNGVQIVRPSLKVTRSGTRYWTILQPDNTEYLNSIGYYDTMPTVSEPCQCLDLEEQFSNTLAKLQQLERPHKSKKKGTPKTTASEVNRPLHDGLNHPFDGTLPDNSKAPKKDDDDEEEEEGGDKNPQKKILGLPSRFLQTPSLLGNLTRFVPDSSGPPCDLGETARVGHPDGREETPSHGSTRRHQQQLLHRQSSVFSDLTKDCEEEDDDDNNVNNNNDDDDFYYDHNAADVTFRLSDSSYSCGGSSCSSLPRDLELERYYASKNMLRLPTGESDDVASCISDHTAVNENLARLPSTTEATEGAAQSAEKNLPDLSEFKKRLKARMSRQTSSQSDSSGFGDSEFVDALAHQQLHSTGKSTMGSLPRLSELGRAGTFDFGTPNVDPHPKRSLGEAARPGALCPSCSGGRNALKVETWCQTPLTSFRQDEDVLGRLEADRPKSFKSEINIDNGGDGGLSAAPLGSEVCLFLRDEPRRPRGSTTLDVRVSKLRPPGRRYSTDVQNAQRTLADVDLPTTYELVSSDDSSFLRRQSLPPMTHQGGFMQPSHQGGLFHHLHQRRYHQHHHHHRLPSSSSSSSSLWRSSRAPLQELELWQELDGTSGHQLMEQASQLPSRLEEIKWAESGSLEGNARQQPFGQSESPSSLLCDEALKQVDRINNMLLDWRTKSPTCDSNGKELAEIRSRLNAVEDLLRLTRDCHRDGSHRRQQQCRQCRQQVSPPFSVPLIVTEPSPKGSSSSQHLRGTQPEQLHTSHPGLLSLPHEASSSSSSPHVASSTLTEGSTESDLEMVKDRLKVVEERLAFQELQESTLRVIFKEFKDSLVEDLKGTNNSQS